MSVFRMSVSDLTELAQLLSLYQRTYGRHYAEADTLLNEVRMKISVSPVRGYSERNPRGAGRHSTITEPQREQVFSLYDKGVSVRQIASETELSVGSVHKLISEHRRRKL